jgi:hypothetical protein
VPRAIADQCNSKAQALNHEHAEIEADEKSMKGQLATIAKTRQAVTETTLANARQQKANNARRDELLVAKQQQESILSDLKPKTR